MARTPFQWVVKSANFGNTPYVVPAGKVAILNTFRIAPPTTIIGSNDVFGLTVTYNGTPAAMLLYAYFSERYGPMVLAAGDTIGSTAAGGTGPSAANEVFGVQGFHYNPSSIKVPFNRLMNTSSSYTVPAGKYVVFNIFNANGVGAFTLKINGTPVASSARSITQPGPASGPFMAAAGQTISFDAIMPFTVWTGNIWLTGFLYNQL